SFDAREVPAASKNERLLEHGLQPVICLLDDTVLVGLAGLDPCRPHTVVVEHRFEPPIELASASWDVVRCCREIIAPEHARNAAELPEGALQARDERLERLAERECDEPPLAE